MVKIKNIILYLLVYLLVTLELTLAVVMEIVEKICLTMHIIKNRLRKWMEDHLMNVYLVSYMERYILWIHICIYTHDNFKLWTTFWRTDYIDIRQKCKSHYVFMLCYIWQLNFNLMY